MGAWPETARHLASVAVGLSAAHIERAVVRRAIFASSLAYALITRAPLAEEGALALSVAALPLARAQASWAWWAFLRGRRTESLAARAAPVRELAHKLIWTAFFAANQGLALGSGLFDAWATAPWSFALLLAFAFAFTLLAAAGAVGEPTADPAPAGWTWCRIQASAAWEELLYRGLLSAVLWPLSVGWTGSHGLAWFLAAALFALPHAGGGHPGGARGVAATFALALACMAAASLAGNAFAAFAVHGLFVGSIGFLRWYRWRRDAVAGVERELALFLIRLEEGLYLTDWEGARVARVAGGRGELARRISELIHAYGPGVAVGWDELRDVDELATRWPAWFERRHPFLVPALPRGALPDGGFPLLALGVLRALAEARERK